MNTSPKSASHNNAQGAQERPPDESKESRESWPKIYKRRLTVMFGLVISITGIALIVFAISFDLEKFEFLEFLTDLLRDMGFVLAPVGILALWERYISITEHEAREEQHIHHITEAIDQRFDVEPKGVKDIRAIHHSRIDIFNDMIRGQHGSVDILATNLNWLTAHLNRLKELAEQGTQIRILALNPRHEFVLRRAPELNSSPKAFFTQMTTSLQHFCEERDHIKSKDARGRLQIRVYNNTPSIMLFRVDTQVVIGFILRHGLARDNIHIEFENPHVLCKLPCDHTVCMNMKMVPCAFMKHFNDVWTNAQDITTADAGKINWDAKAVQKLELAMQSLQSSKSKETEVK